jgi:predicted PhzF superfamily epimerase YddE/YHI9
VLADDGSLPDGARRRVASVTGTSHAVFVAVGDHLAHDEWIAAGERERVSLRFFTGAGELPACGHGTVAALAFLAAGFEAALAGLMPDLDRLRQGCDRLGLLGCFVYSTPSPTARVSARMFAPSIGVPEDIANANSSAGLAALLARTGIAEIAVEMGDALGSPATITAGYDPGRPNGQIRVGGLARIAATRWVSISELARDTRH